MAGLMIGLGAYGFLALGGIPGAVIFGFGLIGVVISGSNLYTGKAGVQAVVAGRFAQGPWRSFLRAVGCGIIIDLSVWLYRTSKSLIPIIFGVPLFILCGFYHSIADVVYLVGAWKWNPAILWFYPIIVIGNFVGCNVRRVLWPKE